MRIFHKNETPAGDGKRDFSVYVFIYYTDNRHFCIGRYDFLHDVWYDNEGCAIGEDFVWTYLPIRQMRSFLKVKGDVAM